MLPQSMEIMARDIGELYNDDDDTREPDFYAGIGATVQIIVERLPDEQQRAAFLALVYGS